MTTEQKRAVQSTARQLSIVACAGSGKTSTIINRVAHVINHGIAKPSEITVITFTVKAADELRIRLQDVVSNTRHLADLYCGTIHAFCHHVPIPLKSPPKSAGNEHPIPEEVATP